MKRAIVMSSLFMNLAFAEFWATILNHIRCFCLISAGFHSVLRVGYSSARAPLRNQHYSIVPDQFWASPDCCDEAVSEMHCPLTTSDRTRDAVECDGQCRSGVSFPELENS
jgi:hypothetical protein